MFGYRGKDYIIQFQSEVIGKVSPMLEAAGGGEEVNCPSILLEFIEHDKPEVKLHLCLMASSFTGIQVIRKT